MSNQRALTEISEHAVMVSTIECEHSTYEGRFMSLQTAVYRKGPKDKQLYIGSDHSHGHIVDQILTHGLDCLEELQNE